MRVVTGSAGGLQLKGPTGPGVRSTTDKVRGAIFNSLGSMEAIDGATVADLFAGTGACGIEALSRGAASVVFVEKDARTADIIRQNLQSTKLDGTVRVEDAMSFLGRPHHFDIAFLDPPYQFDQWPDLLARLSATVAICESNRQVEVQPGWRLVRHKRYGGTDITFFRSEEAE